MSSYAAITLPESGLRNPISICRHTDFPTPLRPITQSVSPRITAKLTRSSTKFDPKDFDTLPSAKNGCLFSPFSSVGDCDGQMPTLVWIGGVLISEGRHCHKRRQLA